MADLDSRYWTSQPGEEPTELERFMAALELTNPCEEYNALKKRVRAYYADPDTIIERDQLSRELNEMDAEVLQRVNIFTRDLDFQYTCQRAELWYRAITHDDLWANENSLFQQFIIALHESLDYNYEQAFAYLLVYTNDIPKEIEALKFTFGGYTSVATLDFIKHTTGALFKKSAQIFDELFESEAIIEFCIGRYRQSLLSATPEEVAKAKDMEASLSENPDSAYFAEYISKRGDLRSEDRKSIEAKDPMALCNALSERLQLELDFHKSNGSPTSVTSVCISSIVTTLINAKVAGVWSHDLASLSNRLLQHLLPEDATELRRHTLHLRSPEP